MTLLIEVYDRLSPEPLSGPELNEYYVDAFAGRGDNPVMPLKRRLYSKPAGELQILFSGYRGCGKSTELNMLQKEIGNDFVVLNFSVLKELDPANISYVELFVLAMEKLFKSVAEHNIEIDPKLLESVLEWSNSKEIERVRTLAGDAALDSGIGVKLSALGFAGFFAKIRASANASYSTKKTVIETFEPRLSELIDHCNDLIRDIKLKLPETGRKGLVIIIEDLDKLSIEKSEELFFNYRYVLRSLRTHVIFTFPVSLCHHPKATAIRNEFDCDFELPMVKVHDKAGRNYDAGSAALYAMIKLRIETDCFDNNELIYRFIDISGGCLRDLFRLIREAAYSALNAERTRISEADYRKAFLRLRRDYENTIAEKRVDHQLLITVDEYFETLKTVALSPSKKVDNTEAALDLRQNLCILGYNDEGWCDLHPIVRSILEERNMLEKEESDAGTVT